MRKYKKIPQANKYNMIYFIENYRKSQLEKEVSLLFAGLYLIIKHYINIINMPIISLFVHIQKPLPFKILHCDSQGFFFFKSFWLMWKNFTQFFQST